MLRFNRLFFLGQHKTTAVSALLGAIVLVACHNSSSEKLVIATAANAQMAIEKIAADFEDQTGIATEIIISSSGKHTAQIEAGAPYDIFISADLKYPNRLFELGLTTKPPEIYAYGKLLLWINSAVSDSSINAILSNEIRHLAIPNPETAPYGMAAKSALVNSGLFDAVSSKIVYGESVAQTNQYIISNTTEAGFTAASTAITPRQMTDGLWIEVPDSLYPPIEQGIVIIKASRKQENAERFFAYLFGHEAKLIFMEYGYSVNSVK
jgi:molybdate transport system substrate-binding protein